MLLRKISTFLLPSTPTNVVATSLACAFGGVVVRVLVDPLLPPGLPYPTFWIASDIATVLAGWRAGAITVALGAMIGWFVWLEPRYSFALPPGAPFVILIFVTFAGLQVLLAELMREALLRAEKMRGERDLVVRELVHRIRNHFSLFNSIAMQTLRTSADLPAASQALQGRLRALMIGLDLAATEGDAAFELAELVEKVVVPLAPLPQRLHVEAVAAQVPREQVHALALVLHELGTNAIKYGAWSGAEGQVRIKVSRDQGRLCLDWTEDGANAVAPGTAGFGTVLITRAIPAADVQLRPGPPYTVAISLST